MTEPTGQYLTYSKPEACGIKFPAAVLSVRQILLLDKTSCKEISCSYSMTWHDFQLDKSLTGFLSPQLSKRVHIMRSELVTWLLPEILIYLHDGAHFPEYQCQFRYKGKFLFQTDIQQFDIVGTASGYITYTDLDNVPDLLKVRFVRQITIGVYQSWWDFPCLKLCKKLIQWDFSLVKVHVMRFPLHTAW